MNRIVGKFLILLGGTALRVYLFSALTWNAVDYISHKIDFSTPLSIYSRLQEGVFRLDNGIDPYSDDYVHVNPILLSLVRNAIPHKTFLFGLLVLIDAIATWLLMGVSGDYYALAGSLFFFNPFTVVSPMSLSIQGFNILLSILVLTAALRNRSSSLCASLIAMHALLVPISPLFLVFPVSVVLGKPLLGLSTKTVLWYMALHGASLLSTGGSPSYFYSTVVSPLMVSTDTLPNFGLTWNIFTVMFERNLPVFQIFFATFLLLIFVPTYIRFSTIQYSQETKERYLVLMICTILLFQHYPTALDFSLVIALILAANEERYHNMASRFFPLVMFAVMVLSSVMSVVYVERNQGTPSFLFNINAVSVIAGAVSTTHSLKVARLDGYTKKQE